MIKFVFSRGLELGVCGCSVGYICFLVFRFVGGGGF